jgi:ABC-2 type transport system permease protein
MNAFLTHFTIDFRIGIRNQTMLLLNYLFPLGFYLGVGFIMTEINPMFTPQLIPAMVIFTMLVTTMLALPDPLVLARDNGIFRSFKVSGVPAVSILAIPALSTLLHLSIASVIILLTAPLLFEAPAPVSMPGFVGVYLVAAFAHAGLGVLVGVISPSSRVTILISQAVFLPSMLLGGLMVPMDVLPEGIARIAQVLPATQAMNAFMTYGMGQPAYFPAMRSLLILLAGGVMAFGLAHLLFSWDRKNSGRRASPYLALLALVPYLLGLL